MDSKNANTYFFSFICCSLSYSLSNYSRKKSKLNKTSKKVEIKIVSTHYAVSNAMQACISLLSLKIQFLIVIVDIFLLFILYMILNKIPFD